MENTDTQTSQNDKYGGLSRRYYWYFIGFMVLLSMFGSYVNDMYVPALPEMADLFGCSASRVQMGLSLGMVGLGLGQIIFGPVSDKYGRKPVLLAGMAIFAAGGTASLFTEDINFFLVCRLIQGFGASTGYFLARTIPADITGGRALARMMALIGAINGIAPASAPVLGGIFSHLLGWKSIFVFLTIQALLIMAISPTLKESLPPARRAKESLFSAFKDYGTLLKNRKFMIHVLFKGAALGMLFAYISSASFIMQRHYGFSDIVYGLFMGGNTIFIVAGSMIALKFKILKRAGVYGAWGLIPVVATQCVALWCIDSFILYETLNCLMLFFLGLIFTMSNTLAMNEGRNDAGRSSAILGVMGYIFGAISTPLVGVGNILHSTAIVIGVLLTLVVFLAYLSKRIAPDLH